jgi:hypothetical protein
MLSQCDALKDIIHGWEKYSTDEVHPNDWGHAVAAAIIVSHLEYIYNNLDNYEVPDYLLPAPVTFNGYENSTVVCNTDIEPALNGWEKYRQGWRGGTISQPLTFEFDAGYITVTYFKTNVAGKGGRCKVKVNGTYVTELNANFTGGWGDFYAITTILKDENIQKNRIEFYPLNNIGEEFIIENILIANYHTDNQTSFLSPTIDNPLFNIRPNPAGNPAIAQVFIPESGCTGSLQLVNNSGKIVKIFKSRWLETGDNLWDFDTSGLPGGIYYAILDLQRSDKREQLTRKLIIQ